MTETAPVYIACAAGNNALTDVLVARHGDLIRLLGHPQMDFAPDDARRLALAILTLLGEWMPRRMRRLSGPLSPGAAKVWGENDPR